MAGERTGARGRLGREGVSKGRPMKTDVPLIPMRARYADMRRFTVAYQSVFHDAAHSSHIVLPIIPADRGKESAL